MKTVYEISIPLFDQTCPESKNEDNCDLRKFIKDERFCGVDKKLYLPVKNWVDTRKTINKMYAICEKCKKQVFVKQK